MPAIDAKAINIHMQVTGPYASQMARNTAVTRTFGNAAHTSMGKAQTSMARFGATASRIATGGAIAIAVGLALSAKAAITFQSSFAGVRKTVETTEVGFQRLSDGIRKLATEIPIGVNELNRIAELGGQLGVEAPDLLEFTETIALVGVTTTLATEETALGFARLDNIMQLGGKSFDRIGSTIVGLGNNFAATEDEILNFALRIAPVGKLVGLTTDEVLAIATAFTSVGIQAESGGTAVQKTFIKIANAVDQGGIDLQVFADTAGLTAEAFAKLFEDDPAVAFEAFVSGLADVEKAGGSAFKVLSAVGLGRERVTRALLAMATAGDTLNNTLERGTGDWEDNLALVEEAEKRFETIASQLIVAKNKIIDLGIAIGTELLPLIGDMALGFSTVIEFLKEQNRTAVIATGAILGLAGATKLAVAHPIIAGLALLAGAFVLIGRNAADAAERIEIMKDVLASGPTSKEGLTTLIGEEGLEGLFGVGFKETDIRRAIFGTEGEYQTFLAQAQSEALLINSDLRGAISAERVLGEDSGFLFAIEGQFGDPISKAVQEIKKRRGEVARLREEQAQTDAQRSRARILGIKSTSSLEQEAISAAGRATVQALFRSRQGIEIEASEAITELKDVLIKPEFVDDVADALGDYVDTVQEAFGEIEDEILSNLDAWYEFDDELEVVWDDIISTLNRQLDAVIGINEKIGLFGLAPDEEALFRSIVADPSVALAFLEMTPEQQGAFVQDVREVAARAREAAAEEWRRRQPTVEFFTGQQFLDDLASIALKIEDDPDNLYNPAEIWLGLILNTLDTEGPEVRRKIIGALIGAFGEGGQLSGEIDATQAQIDLLLLTLLELAGAYDVVINVETEYPDYPTRHAPPLDTTGRQERKAHGGFALADKPYFIGELGPELFVPFNSGTIIPNDKLGGTTTNTTTVIVQDSAHRDLRTDISAGLFAGGVTRQVEVLVKR